MIATASKSAAASASKWIERIVFVLITAGTWAALHYLAGTFLPRGLDRPLVLATSPVAGLLTAAILVVSGVLTHKLCGGFSVRKPLMILGLSLGLWAAEGGRTGGTVDAWLISRHAEPGPPTGGPYWLLLVDYIYLLAGIGGVVFLTRRREACARPAGAMPSTRTQSNGWLATLLTVAVGGIAMAILTCRVLGQTLLGQVYFAAGVGLLFGAYVASHVIKTHDVRWYWPAPFVLGILGLIVAALRPDLLLPADYRHLNTIPAWGLARALPIEMVGAGLVGVLWLVPPSPPADEAPALTPPRHGLPPPRRPLRIVGRNAPAAGGRDRVVSVRGAAPPGAGGPHSDDPRGDRAFSAVADARVLGADPVR